MSDDTFASRGSRRGFGLAAAVLVVVGAATIFALLVTRDSSGHDAAIEATTASDLGFPPPDSAEAAADRDYLAGEGRIILTMHQRALGVARIDLTPVQCEAEAESLDDAAPADEVLARIGGLTDDVLRDAFHAERTALGLRLTGCISGDVDDVEAPDLERAIEAVDTRLHELGA